MFLTEYLKDANDVSCLIAVARVFHSVGALTVKVTFGHKLGSAINQSTEQHPAISENTQAQRESMYL